MNDPERLIRGYMDALAAVKAAGFEPDLLWAESLAYVKPNAEYVMSETAWVILNSGFRYAVARAKWPALTEAFLSWKPHSIHTRRDEVVPAALGVFGHKQKIAAMGEVARLIVENGHEAIVADAADPPRLTRLPFIGKITCWHLAKVLGADVVKPDVHLQRAAAAAGYASPAALAVAIQTAIGKPRERLTVIDSVLWRYGEQMQARKLPGWEALFGPKCHEA